jgi:fructokinase
VGIKKPNQTAQYSVALFGEVLADVFPDKHIMGGAPFNVARHLAGFGIHAVLITRTGNDTLKDELLHQMEAKGLDTVGVQQDPVYPTGQVKVTLHQGQPTYDILPNQAYDNIHAGMTHMITMSLKPDLVYFGTLAQRNIKSRLALDKFLSDAHCPRFLDVNLRPPWFDHHTLRRSLLRSEILKLNENELEIIAKEFGIQSDSPVQMATHLIQAFDLNEVVVTQGEKGAWTLDAKNKITMAELTPQSIKVEDTVGAGDGFASVYILGMLLRWDKMQTLNRANEFAGAICGIRGAVPDKVDFYDRYIQDWGL